MASESKIRAFLALPLAPSFEAEVGPLIEGLKRRYPKIRWIRPSQIHVTFHFFGSTAGEQVDRISKSVSQITTQTSPISLFLSEIGGFPNLARPRVIWLGIGGEIEKLKSLHASLEQELKKEGFQCEERPFKPHLTLGRVKQEKGLHNFGPPEFSSTETKRVTEIVLFESRLSPAGPTYEAIATYPLSKT